jgi:hypothetical protein
MKATKVAIVQSNYIPWRGYFDMIRSVDHFVLYDSVQYTKRDWRNRNKIKTANGTIWLTIPVEVKGKYFQSIRDTRVADKIWAKKHWNSIQLNYAKAPHFDTVKDWLEPLYLDQDFDFLSDINHRFITSILDFLNIKTKLHWSSEFELPEDKTERLVSICSALHAKEYISGPAAKTYLDESAFQKENMKVQWFEYPEYQRYEQLYPPFDPYVSILDLVLSKGKSSNSYFQQTHEQENNRHG